MSYVRKTDLLPDVNTSVLYPNMKIKNYKELCMLLGEETKNGSAKVAQLRRWSKYFKFYKEENKKSYIIEEIYNTPIDLKENRGRTGIYLNDIKALLLHLLSTNGGSLSYLMKIWLYALGLVNINYINHKRLHKEENERIANLYIFIGQKSKTVLRIPINSLLDEDLITLIKESADSGKRQSYRVTLTDKGKEVVPPNVNVEDLRNSINQKILNYFENKYSEDETKLDYIRHHVKL